MDIRTDQAQYGYKQTTKVRIVIFTIGHSNRSLDDFLLLLREFGVQALADVRRYPSSRKFPHFNKDILRVELGRQNISYAWFEPLGGRRHAPAEANSPNKGLQQAPAFRNYADYMMTAPFQETVRQLLSFASGQPTAVMCAEKLFWKCHRRLLSDFLVAKGQTVAHIIDPGQLSPHKLTQNAVINTAGTVIYPRRTLDTGTGSFE